MSQDPLETLTLVELTALEQHLRARLTELDRRVQHHLAFAGGPTAEHVGGVDVLCAAILEARELLGAVRRQGLAERERLAARRARRGLPRR
jgi:hypothetical protein